MIAKVPAKRNDGRSSFGSLGHYMTGDQIDRETGEIKREAASIHVETNCLFANTATAEMRAVADQNARVKDPVYHCILSWREGENPTNAQMIEAAKAAQKAIGMDGHQYVYAIHRGDTDNAHVHMMINRVNPETYKAVYPDRDFYKLDKCMRQVELAQGWQHDNGPHKIENGKIVRVGRDPDQPKPLPTKAKDFEMATGCESLITYAQGARQDALEAIKSGSWQELHSVLKKHGLEIREAGQGFRIYSTADKKEAPIKASDMAPELGGGKLKKALGDFEKPLRAVAAEKPEREYNKHREKNASREAAAEERAEARRKLRERFEQYRTEQAEDAAQLAKREARRAELKTITAETREARAKIRVGKHTPEAKKIMLSVAAMDAVKKRERIKAEHKKQRTAEKAAAYKTWVGEQAAAGDPAALAQLKGWHYSDQRRRKAQEKEEAEAAARGAITAPGDNAHDPARPATFTDEIEWRADKKTGDVFYMLAGKEALRDTGKIVAVLNQSDENSILAGLMLASQKFGPTLTLTGPMEFQKLAVEVAVKSGQSINFKDPRLEKYRADLVKQRDVMNGNKMTVEKSQSIPAKSKSNSRV